MNKEKALIWLLRLEAIVVAMAILAVILPTEWMAKGHQLLGLGEFPRAPIVEYLTRSIAALYATWAPLLWYVSNDVRRYQGVIIISAWTRIFFGMTLLGVDIYSGLPWYWTVAEGPTLILVALVQLILAKQLDKS